MRLVIDQKMPFRRVLWVDPDGVWLGCGLTAERWENGRRVQRVRLPGTALQRVIASHRLTGQALRWGVHNFWPTSDGGAVAIGKRIVLRRELRAPSFRTVAPLRIGNKPAFNGLCADADGALYYGEYALNDARRERIGLYRSTDQGRQWQLILEFAPGQVRHIHLVQWDPYERCLWLGTGDRGDECRLLRSFDRGQTWQTVGAGSQMWRVVTLVFRPEAVYWGNDAGGPDAGVIPASLLRWDRKTHLAEKIMDLQGPAHGACSLADGTILIGTGVEGGANEKDNCAHLWCSRDGVTWTELSSWRKDAWSYLVHFGVLRFPHGASSVSDVHFTGYGLRGAGEVYFRGRIES